MGNWARGAFGRETFGDVGVIMAGSNSESTERMVLGRNFTLVNSNRNRAYHSHLVSNPSGFFPVVSNVYGAPAVIDVLAQMQDGGCRNVIFVGYAFGFGDLKVGDVAVPTIAISADGVYQAISKPRSFVHPDSELRDRLTDLIDSGLISYRDSKHISVPSVIAQHPHREYGDLELNTLDMEVAATYSASIDFGMRSAAVLIISDTRNDGLGDGKNIALREKRMGEVLDLIFGNLEEFSVKPDLPSEFSIDKHLASIVGMSGEEGNAYTE